MIYIDPSGLEDEEGLACGDGPMTSEEEDHSEDALVNGGSESRSKDVSDFLFEGLPEEYEDEGRLKLLKSVLEEDRENRNRTTLELDLISFLSDLAFPFCPPVFYAGGQIAAAKNLERTKDAYNIGLAEERDVDICAFTTAFGSLPGPTGTPLSGFQLGYDIGRMNGWW